MVRALPLALVVVLAATRLLPGPAPPGDPERLYEQASRAYGEERWAAAAEYARHAVALLPRTEPRRAELLCVRGEALLRSGRPRES